ncbi:hypothetical protein ACWC5I_10595 [Kitasatospora sp. NPDC001574]
MTGTDVSPARVLELFGGMPFLDDAFRPGRLLGAVSSVRQVQAARQGLEVLPDSRQWLAPERAVECRANAEPVASYPMPAERRERVELARKDLVRLLPVWEPLFQLPVNYLMREGSALSGSSFWWPQHVYIGEASFSSDLELREHVLHEQCHQWLYLLEELFNLDLPDSPELTLPSGTSDRTPREVVGAAHVAAVLVRLYRAEDNPGHLAPLTAYGRGCLALLERHDHTLTDAGRVIVWRLKEAL